MGSLFADPSDRDEPPSSAPASVVRDSSSHGRAARDAIALDIAEDTLRAEVRAVLVRNGYSVLDADAIPKAALVVASATDVVAAVADLRSRARLDAAVVIVAADRARVADAHRAGALACLTVPLVEAQLLGAAHAALRAPHVDVEAHDDPEPRGTSISRIAAALSHELGTPLAALSMNLDVVGGECERLAVSEAHLRAILDAPPESRSAALELAAAHLDTAPAAGELFEALEDARGSVERMRHLLTQMKELVGRPVRTLRAVDVDIIAGDARRRAVDAVLENVRVEVELESGVRAIGATGPIEATIAHLLRNAAVAASELSSPRVSLRVRLGDEEAVVSVCDNGPGIPHDVQGKVFEPFFTTRRGLGGVGLGLALCREWARQIGGRLTLWSVPGRGTCFRLHLKRAR
ncbi:MAG: hypothetical protein NVSMB47_11830 [Polyangiales bacterium]